jgi:glycyl-tRNA synthetase (class II)
VPTSYWKIKLPNWMKKVKPSEAEELQGRNGQRPESRRPAPPARIIIEQNIKCPVSGTANWTDVRQFNLMFSTQVGAVADESDVRFTCAPKPRRAYL